MNLTHSMLSMEATFLSIISMTFCLSMTIPSTAMGQASLLGVRYWLSKRKVLLTEMGPKAFCELSLRALKPLYDYIIIDTN